MALSVQLWAKAGDLATLRFLFPENRLKSAIEIFRQSLRDDWGLFSSW